MTFVFLCLWLAKEPAFDYRTCPLYGLEANWLSWRGQGAQLMIGWNRAGYSCNTTVSSDLLTLILPLYSMKPSFLNLFMKKLTRERVVPTMLARVSCETLGKTRTG